MACGYLVVCFGFVGFGFGVSSLLGVCDLIDMLHRLIMVTVDVVVSSSLIADGNSLISSSASS